MMRETGPDGTSRVRGRRGRGPMPTGPTFMGSGADEVGVTADTIFPRRSLISLPFTSPTDRLSG